MPNNYTVKDGRRLIKERALLETVTEDLTYLRDEWDNKIDDAALRRDSNVLRRLLVQHDYLRAWRSVELEGRPELTGGTLRPFLDLLPLEKIEFASAGGARYRALTVQGVLSAKAVLRPEEIQKYYTAGVPPSETLSVKDYIESPCLVVEGTLVPRRVLIKYVANKLGGSHYDPGRTGEDRIFTRLDDARRWEIAEKPAVYLELLSIGQALVAAQSTTILQEAIARRFSVE